MKKSGLRKWFMYGLMLILGILAGRIMFHSPAGKGEEHDHGAESVAASVWTCSMHPQVKADKPGLCPLCGMDLIPLEQYTSSLQSDSSALHMTAEAVQLANVLTTRVTSGSPARELRLYGKVQFDEQLLQSQVAQFPGRIEMLFVNYTGQQVGKGDKLAELYSPGLVTAQQELLETVKTKSAHPELYEAAREKLRQWKLTDSQIAAIEDGQAIIKNFEVLSTTTGTVISRRVNTGDFVSGGTVLYDIAGLSVVWVLFDAYESDLPFINKGDLLKFSLQALPGREFAGRIVFIDPVIDPLTRVAKVRVEVSNAGGDLKPEMFATGIVTSRQDKYMNSLVIPRSAVLWTGKRSLVYVKDQDSSEPLFRIREIGLGPLHGDSYIVTSGLAEGEEIVTNGTFSVDAAAQLAGKPSMMNR